VVENTAEMIPQEWPSDLPPKRADLHCHSDASNEADEAALNAIACPESFSSPLEVYEQAKRRGMDFVTITDHDSLEGVVTLCRRDDLFIGEELTCYFPHDHCKIHLLLWGLNADDHQAVQAVAKDIYQVARIVEERRLAHAVAHPLYRQNDRLEKWHLERLILMFKGFETLNGAHSVLHRQAIEPMIADLTVERIAELAAEHDMLPRWPQPHIKSRTGGSDDHGLFNIGRTWTEFPGDVTSIAEALECIRTGRCRPGGEAGSSLKLAHNFYGVGIRYYGRRMRDPGAPASLTTTVLQTLLGERQPRRREWLGLAVKSKARKLARRLVRPFRKTPEKTGTALLMDLFVKACAGRVVEHPAIGKAISTGMAPLGEHAAMFDFVSAINRDIAAGVADSIFKSLDDRKLSGVFDSVATIAAHQFLLMPYYFSMFHQNRERQVLPRLTGRQPQVTSESMKLGVFTDTFDEINGVARFIQDMCRQARGQGKSLIVHTSSAHPCVMSPSRKNFTPLLSRPMPAYADQPVTLPPLAEILEWADRQQFDAIHVHTPGPMGLCGWLVAKMLRVPMLATYHTDFPQYVNDILGDHRLTTMTTSYMQWFYGKAGTVFSRSKEYCDKLRKLEIDNAKLTMMLPGVDVDKFSPAGRDMELWPRLGIAQTHKLLYVGRVSVEKNLPLLLEAFRRLCASRKDTALVIAGDGPYLQQMKKAAAGLPVHFLGYQNDRQLAALYASSDLFVFPSKTDTLGQVVIEAQAAGLPVLVSNLGGPKEVMDDQITGLVLNGDDAAAWQCAIHSLLDDVPRRMRMSRTAPQRMTRFSLLNVFESFWEEHVKLASAAKADAETPAVRREETAAV
jgi:glycosyltransferase involved in cell wall biosynthesis